jgi:hypothetical protein
MLITSYLAAGIGFWSTLSLLGRYLLEHRRYHPARTTPLCPEVDQDRPVAAYRIVEGAVAEGDDVLGHYFELSLVGAPFNEGSQCGG